MIYITRCSISRHGTTKKCAKLLGESEIETVLQRLDRLTEGEARVAAAVAQAADFGCGPRPVLHTISLFWLDMPIVERFLSSVSRREAMLRASLRMHSGISGCRLCGTPRPCIPSG